MASLTEGPLTGTLVADFTRVLAGPLATMTLADLGADVIKVEAPSGDETRSWKPPEAPDGTATYFLAANRNKRSVALDLNDPAERRLAGELARRSDVLVENFKPGGARRFGLDYEELRADNRALVYCSISAFGDAGGGLPGYDPLLQALSGLMSITGEPGGEPTKVGVALIDVIAGLNAATAILAALIARQATGEGQRIEITLLTSALAALANQASGLLAGGEAPRRMGNVHPSIEPFATYAAADGPLMICAGNDRQFSALAQALSEPGLVDDPAFRSNSDRVANRERLRERIEARLSTAKVAEWVSRLRSAGVPAGPVNDVRQAFELARRLGLDAVTEADGIPLPGSPLGLAGTPPTTRRPPPRLDEHGDEIRSWLRS